MQHAKPQTPPLEDQPKEPPKFELSMSRLFTSWLHEQGCSISFTTYQAGKFFLLGMQDEEKPSIFERTFCTLYGHLSA